MNTPNTIRVYNVRYRAEGCNYDLVIGPFRELRSAELNQTELGGEGVIEAEDTCGECYSISVAGHRHMCPFHSDEEQAAWEAHQAEKERWHQEYLASLPE